MARTWPPRVRARRLPIRDSAGLSNSPIAFTLGAGHFVRIGVGAGQMPDVSPVNETRRVAWAAAETLESHHAPHREEQIMNK